MKSQARLRLRKPDDDLFMPRVLGPGDELFMPRVKGKSFYCHCGANVFRRRESVGKVFYICNACSEVYEGT